MKKNILIITKPTWPTRMMRLFLHKKGQGLGLEEDHQTQQKRHEKKETDYIINWQGNYNRAFFKKLSKK